MIFEKFAEYLERLEKISSRLEITDELAKLIKELRTEESSIAIYLLLGKLGAEYENQEFGMAARMVIRAVAEVSGESIADVEREYKRTGDVGSLVMKNKSKSGVLNINEVYQRLLKIAQEGGEGSQEKKVSDLANLIKGMSGLEQKFVLRMVMGKLRLGFSSKTIFDALSVIERGNKSLRKQLDVVYQIYPDAGYLVERFKKDGVEGLSKIKAKVCVPVVPALCQRLNEYSAIIEKMEDVGVERKYDGTRVQIHFDRIKGEIRTYTRNLEENSAMFPELVNLGKWIKADKVILDCEAVGVDPKSGKILSFQMTITRKRKHGIEEVSKQVPLKFFVFDVLVKDEDSLLHEPYADRREILKALINKNDVLVVDEVVRTDSAAKVEELHDQYLKEGFEGAVIKKWNGEYLPGRQGWNWVKIKEAEGEQGKLSDTLDLVVMGYYSGRGKRVSFGIGAFLVGLKRGESWVSLCKIGTGLTDQEFRDLKVRLDDSESKEKPDNYEVEGALIPDVWVKPRVVVEVAADEITKSPNHAGGLALRFPRLVKFRDDKGPDQSTTWKEVLVIAKMH